MASAAVVTVGMLPHLRPVLSSTTLVLLVGVAAWLVELLATPTSRVAEGLLMVMVGGCGAVLNGVAPQSPGFVLAYFAVAGLGLRFRIRHAALLSLLVVGLVDLGIALASTQVAGPASARVTTSVTTSDLGLAFVFMVAATTRSARSADVRSRWLLAELEESRAAQAASAALAERTRLAREIHDILAHSLSGQVMSLEATRMLAERTSTDARVITEIERAHRLAKSGLADTRRAIGALRGDPLPGPELIPQLVEQARAAHGIRATLTVTGAPRPVLADTGLCLYRTTQEALTNTAKHAGRGASSEVALDWEDDRVLLTVTDRRRDNPGDDLPAGSSLPSGGYGLTGLRERAELADGILEAIPTATGFMTRLTLPLASSRSSEGPQ
ncbi:MAG: sensor histidine kinase [Nakamurella sp.]